jgi:hypothetical protein
MTFHFPSRTKIIVGISVAGAVLISLVDWAAVAAETPNVPPGFLPLGMSINQLMVGVVDDAAHGIWAGGNKNTPLTDEEWVDARMSSFQLEAAATLVSLGGTGAADHGWVMAPRFQQWVRTLRDQALVARDAADSKDQTALRSAGDTLVNTCNSCHAEFKPDVPTEGILLNRGHGY